MIKMIRVTILIRKEDRHPGEPTTTMCPSAKGKDIPLFFFDLNQANAKAVVATTPYLLAYLT